MPQLNLGFLLILLSASLIISSCQNGGETEPKQDADILEFSVQELSDVSLSVDQSQQMIKVTNHESITGSVNLSSLTASFVISEGASVFVEDVPQQSGETINDFTEGVFYTVVSEDEQNQQTYFVYLTKELPLNYLVDGELETELNPSGKNPLGAQVLFESRVPSTTRFEVLGNAPISQTFDDPALSHAVPIVGLYADHQNNVVLTISPSDQPEIAVTDTLMIETTTLPEFLPSPEINIINETQMEPGMHFNEFSIGNAGNYNTYPLIFDNDGNIRWFVDLSEVGRIAWAVKLTTDNTFYVGDANIIREFDLLGNEINTIAFDDKYLIHHEVRKMPNGNYLVAVNNTTARMIKNGVERNSVEDFILEVSPSGDILTEWDMAEILDVNRTDLTDGGHDWFHMNAIWYDEEDEALVISGRNQGIVKVNWDNELQWIMAPTKAGVKPGAMRKRPKLPLSC